MRATRDKEIPRLVSGTAETLARFDTGLISDALERIQGPRVALGLRALSTKPRRIAGPAITVELGPLEAGNTQVHLGARAIDSARRGDVIVVANEGRLDVAAWGGLLSAGAEARAVEAVVIDGACRDVDDLWDLELEVFCKGVVPLTARGRITQKSFNEPVCISGVEASPGDWVVGDASGIVIVPAGHVEEVLSTAQQLALREADMRHAILAGEPVAEVLDASYESLLETHDEGS